MKLSEREYPNMGISAEKAANYLMNVTKVIFVSCVRRGERCFFQK
jgi:hypothetical protein